MHVRVVPSQLRAEGRRALRVVGLQDQCIGPDQRREQARARDHNHNLPARFERRLGPDVAVADRRDRRDDEVHAPRVAVRDVDAADVVERGDAVDGRPRLLAPEVAVDREPGAGVPVVHVEVGQVDGRQGLLGLGDAHAAAQRQVPEHGVDEAAQAPDAQQPVQAARQDDVPLDIRRNHQVKKFEGQRREDVQPQPPRPPVPRAGAVRVEHLRKIAPALSLFIFVLHRAAAHQRKQEERVARVVGAHRARHDSWQSIGQREGRAVGHDQGFVEHGTGRQRVPEGPAGRAARKALP